MYVVGVRGLCVLCPVGRGAGERGGEHDVYWRCIVDYYYGGFRWRGVWCGVVWILLGVVRYGWMDGMGEESYLRFQFVRSFKFGSPEDTWHVMHRAGTRSEQGVLME